MKRIYRILILVGVVILVVAVVGVYAANQPLSKGLSVTLPASTQAIDTSQIQLPEQVLPTRAQPKSEPTQLPTEQVDQLPASIPSSYSCGVQGSTTILVLGESNPEPNEKRGADAIRLVKVDFDKKNVTVLGIPSSLVIRVIGKDTITLTYVYFQAKSAAKGDDQSRMLAATNALAQAFADHFGYIPEHYITINQQLFSTVVDTLGGITVNVPADVDATSDNKGYFKAGEQVFTGSRALDYVRFINSNQGETKLEVGRLQRQNDVLKAILARAQQPENWGKAPQLVEQLYGNVVSDLNLKQMMDYACLYRDPAFQVSNLEIPSAVIVRAADLPLFPIDPQFGDFIKKSMQ